MVIVVSGIGNSGADIAVDISHAASQVSLLLYLYTNIYIALLSINKHIILLISKYYSLFYYYYLSIYFALFLYLYIFIFL